MGVKGKTLKCIMMLLLYTSNLLLSSVLPSKLCSSGRLFVVENKRQDIKPLYKTSVTSVNHCAKKCCKLTSCESANYYGNTCEIFKMRTRNLSKLVPAPGYDHICKFNSSLILIVFYFI